ncbi:hypothetical protein HBI39_248290 [Parastagonospora nodorum]|nr:hypothetical protein HBI39_248290 [Parastagonospora nodorum]
MAGSLPTPWAWAKRERWCSPSSWDTFTSRTGRKCKMREQKATRQNTTQLTMTTSHVLLKARERSTARAKGAPPSTPNLDKQPQ